jgi:hypothetical protein
MGYYSRLSGELTINPPLKWGQFRDSEFFDDRANENWRNGYACIRFRVERDTAETDEGKREVITAVAVEPSTEDSMKVYELKVELQRLVDAFPVHEFTGEFLIEGEESGDIWKLVVDDNRKAAEIHPRIVWPDGSELRGRHSY